MNLRDSSHKISRFSQSYFLPLLSFPLFNLFFKMKIVGMENLKDLKSPSVIVSNHIAFYDSFAFRLILKPHQLPIRFMAVKKFDSFFLRALSALYIVDLVYLLFGVFVIEHGRGIDRNLEGAESIIKDGGNVVMYPEGSIVNTGQLGVFKLGAGALAKKTGAQILPVSMKLVQKKFFRREFVIHIGEIMDIDTNMSPEEITKLFFRRVSALYESRLL